MAMMAVVKTRYEMCHLAPRAAAATVTTVITTPPPCGLPESLTRSYNPDSDSDGVDGLQTSCGEYSTSN
jgi:hypothetical protein